MMTENFVYQILRFYRIIFCHKIFYRLNHHLHRLSLRGIGVLNSEGNDISGERYLLKKMKNKNIRTVLDVGANIGWYAMDVHHYLPEAEIFAVEPHPKTFSKLKNHVQGMRVNLFNVGMGNQIGTTALWDFADDATLKYSQPESYVASTIKFVIEDYHKQKSQSFTVPITTIDAFAEQENISIIDLLKIDTEGNELDVLKGARFLLESRRIRFIQFEFNEMNVYSRTYFKDFLELLPGYRFYRLMPSGFYSLGDYKPSTHEIFAFQNILAVPEGEEIQ